MVLNQTYFRIISTYFGFFKVNSNIGSYVSPKIYLPQKRASNFLENLVFSIRTMALVKMRVQSDCYGGEQYLPPFEYLTCLDLLEYVNLIWVYLTWFEVHRRPNISQWSTGNQNLISGPLGSKNVLVVHWACGQLGTWFAGYVVHWAHGPLGGVIVNITQR